VTFGVHLFSPGFFGWKIFPHSAPNCSTGFIGSAWKKTWESQHPEKRRKSVKYDKFRSIGLTIWFSTQKLKCHFEDRWFGTISSRWIMGIIWLCLTHHPMKEILHTCNAGFWRSSSHGWWLKESWGSDPRHCTRVFWMAVRLVDDLNLECSEDQVG